MNGQLMLRLQTFHCSCYWILIVPHALLSNLYNPAKTRTATASVYRYRDILRKNK